MVSGRARDDAGKMSEPIVKEELAIVEFLTAKNSGKAVAAAANSSSNGPARAEGSDENTPVDLLLGLAKTNTGRRAAEEEKRQLRLQQRREQEEQRQAQRRMQTSNMNGNGGLSANPWNYVAPQMPGLDVHQPFGEQGNRRLPRPLQPPSGRRDSGGASWSPENPFGFNENTRSSPSFNSNILPQQPQQPQFGNNGNTNNNQQQINLSPYQEMTLPLPSPNDQMMTGQNDMFQQSGAGLEFGTAIGESFDFSNLGLPRQGTDAGFNPFAIAQTGAGDEGSGSEPGPDDETTFLNFILTKFANSSGENL